MFIDMWRHFLLAFHSSGSSLRRLASRPGCSISTTKNGMRWRHSCKRWSTMTSTALCRLLSGRQERTTADPRLAPDAVAAEVQVAIQIDDFIACP